MTTVLLVVGAAVVAFVAGVLVGRANSNKVNTVVSDAKTIVADVKAKV